MSYFLHFTTYTISILKWCGNPLNNASSIFVQNRTILTYHMRKPVCRLDPRSHQIQIKRVTLGRICFVWYRISELFSVEGISNFERDRIAKIICHQNGRSHLRFRNVGTHIWNIILHNYTHILGRKINSVKESPKYRDSQSKLRQLNYR